MTNCGNFFAAYDDVGEMVCDLSYEYIKGLVKSVRLYDSKSTKHISEYQKNKWWEKLWFTNHQMEPFNLYCLLESRTYELREEIIKYLESDSDESDE